ncbi:hypothetical protein PF003_g40515 [Phytophthora fragariae]|nr:hypothetical protein PF003_g40515 [Phytophthora fragariae]
MDVEDADSGERSTYDETLEKWALHDCSAVEDSRGDDEMGRLFERWRATRTKPDTARGAVTIRSKDRSWTAFIQ